MRVLTFPFLHFLTISIFITHSLSFSDTLTSTQSLTNNQTLVSTGEVFELGFFTPGNSNKWFLGIWYKNIRERTYVWVANRDNPLTDQAGIFKVGNKGNIVVLDQEDGNLKWSSNETNTSHPLVVKLLDTGNLVVKEDHENSDEFLWQSFDYPTDTLLPGMKLGWDFRNNVERHLTSWKSNDDPSTGDYSFKLDFHGFPEVFLLNKQDRKYRSGPWVGTRFSGVPEMKPLPEFNFVFVKSQDEVFYSYSVIRKYGVTSRLVVNSSGMLWRYTWTEETQRWTQFWYAPKDPCDNYLECGPFGICDANASPVCKCVDGFKPKKPQVWSLRDGSDGCVRKTELDCKSDGFSRLTEMKLPETSKAVVNAEMGLDDCRDACLRNCSCSGYANSNVSSGRGSGCVMWSGELLDMRQYAAKGGGQDLFVRVSASDLGSLRAQDVPGKTKQVIKIVSIAFGIGILLFGLIIFVAWKREVLHCCREKKEEKGIHDKSQDFLLNEVVISSKRDYSAESKSDEVELPLFDYDTIVVATDNFSDDNKLGQGGFGCVYKGRLIEGHEVAVKRLSRNSGQGIEEFKNEVRLIARLQHRNLVRLLGCCVETEEKMLLYEYMENRSLDSILFSKTKSSLLDWQRRFNIITGIARGLVYLHQDSRFRIIHRDLKASNILLDGEMNPKISDFGMARIFGGDDTEASTKRVVGTYGYMSPEYAMDGVFSVKSDAFSFGVLLLEIVSGKKNRGFYHSNSELNILEHAWRLWRDGKGIELLDAAAGDSYSIQEVLRSIQVGLLCVQERAEDRPTMSTVVLMLGSESASMAHPKQPGFCLRRHPLETDSSSSKQDETFTVNQVTVTTLDAR